MNRCFRPFTFCVSIAFLTSLAIPSHAQDEFRPMFNGKDLSGWVLTNTPPETWRFEDGLLICSGKPIGEIRTEKMYQNFIMELEWRHMVPRGNAGVFVWADDITARGVPFHRGIEVQILEDAYGNTQSHTTHGDIFPIHGASMTPINGRKGSRAFPSEHRALPSPQWNHYRIECRDGEISLAVNGQVVTRGEDAVPRKGYICLESEGGVVHYRNVKIQELPGSDLPPEQVAIADRGYRSLYSGLDLNGWKAAGDDHGWESNDWVLSFKEDDYQEGRLSSTDEFQSLGFVVDVRLKADSSNAVIHTGAESHIDLGRPEIAKLLEPVGRWNRLEGTLVDGKYTLLVNGQPASTADRATPSGKGSITLAASGAVDFCNLYARTLTANGPKNRSN